MNFTNNVTRLVAIAMIATCLAGCKKQDEPSGTSTTEATAAKVPALPADLVVSSPIEGAISVEQARNDKSLTGPITVTGRIGGRVKPFIDGVAMFLLADSVMKSCDELHGDACKTPWDYCCEPKESLNAKLATIQVVGDDGKPLKIDLNGVKGIKPAARITVSGSVANREGGVLVINAQKIHVQ